MSSHTSVRISKPSTSPALSGAADYSSKLDLRATSRDARTPDIHGPTSGHLTNSTDDSRWNAQENGSGELNGTAHPGKQSLNQRSSRGFLLQSVASSTAKKRRTTAEDGFDTLSRPSSGWWSNDAISSTPNLAYGSTTPYSTSAGVLGSSSRDGGNLRRKVYKLSKGKETASPNASPTPDEIAEATSTSVPRINTAATEGNTSQPDSQPASMYSNQLVQLALSLSESRRLHLGPGQLASMAVGGDRRSVSASDGQYYRASHESFRTRGESLRPSTDSYRRTSMASPRYSSVTSRSTPNTSNHLYGSATDMDMRESSTTLSNAQAVSESTLIRAERARVFFELAHEYRRLLSTLPPLVSSTWLNGQSNLGRSYNPLQYIRNRQVRARERQTLDAATAGWNNLEAVRLWVNMVEVEAQDESSRSGDVQLLPSWNSKLRTSSVQSVAPWAPPDTSDVDTTTHRPKLERLDWSITPADMLADAYWLEQGRNKALIEFRNGSRIYDRFHDTSGRFQIIDTQPEFEDAPLQAQSTFHSTADSVDTAQPLSPQQTRNGNRYTQAHSPRAKNGRVARVARHILHRHKEESQNLSGSDISDLEDHIKGFNKRGSTIFDNTGPLEKHMKEVLASDPQHPSGYDLDQELSVETEVDDAQHRRGGVSGTVHDDVWETRHQRQLSSSDYASARGSVGTDVVITPRISIEDTDAGVKRDWTAFESSEKQQLEGDDTEVFLPEDRSRVVAVSNAAGDSQTVKDERIAETDFAFKPANKAKRPLKLLRRFSNSPRSSYDSPIRSQSFKDINSLRTIPKNGVKSQTALDALNDSDSPGTTSARFFKGGRIGDIVRSERPRFGNFVWKRPAPPVKSVSSVKPGQSSSSSDADDYLMIQNGDRRKKPSTNASKKGNYYLKNLPPFKSARVLEQGPHESNGRSRDDDHISRQVQAQRANKAPVRRDRLAALSVETKEISPGTSSLDLKHESYVKNSSKSSTRDHSPTDIERTSTTQSNAGAAHDRLRTLLGTSGMVARSGPPMTGLARYSVDRPDEKSSHYRHHHWSIADGRAMSGRSRDRSVTRRDIAYVESLLLSTGIKAKTIVQTANSVRETPLPFLTEAARLCNASLRPVVRRQEHVIAARLLSGSLETFELEFEADAEHFREKTCTQLHARLDDLYEKVGSKLTPLVRSCADDADAFIARLTTTHTLAIKQVNDSVDLMLRSRSRRLRWLRHAGFKMLEVIVVGLLWWIWLFVYILKGIKWTMFSLGRGLGWLVWP